MCWRQRAHSGRREIEIGNAGGKRESCGLGLFMFIP